VKVFESSGITVNRPDRPYPAHSSQLGVSVAVFVDHSSDARPFN
jgi:hypothetical protein